MRREIKFGGYGGQGIILAGYITGMAASLYDNRYAVFTQNYGPEARGGASSSEVVISDEPIDYPYVTSADSLVIMSIQAYDRYIHRGKKGCVVLVDEDLVEIDERAQDKKVYKIRSTRIAEELGNRIVANIVMLGFFTSITGFVSENAMKKAIENSVPERFLELNIKAFRRGFEEGIKCREE